ncbi:hypothetical protein [Euzebyella saccharophila]|uniref:Uncharacterized protein n=1 Tax=Euzebyella saccharophila TaxID=679664 RepID=A0ABV8JN25_9FLAO|nr:hypothetical protein [Euzebyella saccharophila]MDO1499467.1 hypothetical protein [Winogradskyella maritima]
MKKCLIMFGLLVLTLVLAIVTNDKEPKMEVEEFISMDSEIEKMSFDKSQSDSMELAQK